jgi:hypothetical protein
MTNIISLESPCAQLLDLSFLPCAPSFHPQSISPASALHSGQLLRGVHVREHRLRRRQAAPASSSHPAHLSSSLSPLCSRRRRRASPLHGAAELDSVRRPPSLDGAEAELDIGVNLGRRRDGSGASRGARSPSPAPSSPVSGLASLSGAAGVVTPLVLPLPTASSPLARRFRSGDGGPSLGLPLRHGGPGRCISRLDRFAPFFRAVPHKIDFAVCRACNGAGLVDKIWEHEPPSSFRETAATMSLP